MFGTRKKLRARIPVPTASDGTQLRRLQIVTLLAVVVLGCVPRADIMSDKPQTSRDAKPFERNIYPTQDTIGVDTTADGVAMKKNNRKAVDAATQEKLPTSAFPPAATAAVPNTSGQP